MERDTADNAIWPYRFKDASQDQARSASDTGPEGPPWLYGVDGRHRGGLASFEGMSKYSSLVQDLFGDPSNSYVPGSGERALNEIIVVFYGNPSNNQYIRLGSSTSNGPYITFTTAASTSETAQIGATAYATAQNYVTALGTCLGAAKVTNEAVYRHDTQTNFAWVKFNLDYTTNPTKAMNTSNVVMYPDSTSVWKVLPCITTTNAEITFAKPFEIRKTANTFVRGIVMRIGMELVIGYTTTEGGSAFTTYAHVTTTDTTGYKLSVTDDGRCLYIVGTDGTNSLARVAYWHPDYSQLIVTNMGTALSTVTGSSPAITATATSGNTYRIPLGGVVCAYRGYDSTRQRWSPMTEISGDVAPSPFAPTTDRYFRVNYSLPTAQQAIAVANNYNEIELYSTISSGVNLVGPAANQAGGVQFIRTTFDCTAGTTATYTGGDATAGTYADAMTDTALVLQEYNDPVLDYVESTVPQMEAIHFYQGANFILTQSDGFVNIQWSRLDRQEAENFPPLNIKRTRIRANGGAQFVEAGDYLWVLGDGESYRIQKEGESLAIHRFLDNFSFVGRTCATTLGSDIIAVSTQGVQLINGNTGTAEQITALDRLIHRRWSKLLRGKLYSGKDIREKIYCAYDGRLHAVFIYCRPAAECAILWVSTNRVTMLTDCLWSYMITSYLPNTRADAKRALMFTEDVGADNAPSSFSSYYLPGNILYPADTPQTLPNMAGLTVANLDDLTNLTFTATAGVSSGYVYVGHGSTSDVTAETSYQTLFSGGMLYVLTGSLAGSKYPIINANRGTQLFYLASTNSAVATAINNQTVCIAPVVTAICGWPLGSLFSESDLMSRRVVDSATCRLGNASTLTTGTYGVCTYGLVRQPNTGDDTILSEYGNGTDYPGTTDDLENRSAVALPWTNTWTASGGGSYTLNTSALSSQADGGTPDSGLYADLRGDGALLYPTIQFNLPGFRFNLLGMWLYGKVHPNESVSPV